MFLSGTLLNALAVFLGTTVGLLAGSRFPDRIRSGLTTGIGLFVLAIAASMALHAFDDPALQAGDSLVILGSVLIGVVIGEWLRLQERLEAIGGWFERRLERRSPRADGGPSRVAEAFVTSSLVFCVGPLTILGALQNGLTGDATLLATKAVLDGVSSAAFAAALGGGVYLSILTILVVQGGIAAAAFAFRDVLDVATVAVITGTGGIILLGMGLRLLEVKPVRVAGFLPALVIAPFLLRLADAIRAALG
jgi:uncharacterized membrane protein YqgA involved in biofilm formation